MAERVRFFPFPAVLLYIRRFDARPFLQRLSLDVAKLVQQRALRIAAEAQEFH